MPYYIARDMILKQNARSVMELPTLQKVVLHSSTHSALSNRKNILPLFVAMQLWTMQTPTLTRAKQSVASFKLKQGQLIGCKVTLRKKNMHRFVQTFTHAVLPRVRDLAPYRTTPVDLSFGFTSYLLFPQTEHLYDFFEHCTGFQCTYVCSKLCTHVTSGYGIPVTA